MLSADVVQLIYGSRIPRKKHPISCRHTIVIEYEPAEVVRAGLRGSVRLLPLESYARDAAEDMDIGSRTEIILCYSIADDSC
jgi:hypothetical protein